MHILANDLHNFPKTYSNAASNWKKKKNALNWKASMLLKKKENVV